MTTRATKLGALIAVVALTACGSNNHPSATQSPAPTGAPTETALDETPTTIVPGGAGTDGADGPINADPCSLLTGAEVASALGGVGESKAGSGLTGGPSCTWTFHQPSVGFVTLSLELLPAQLCSTERALQRSPVATAAGNTLYSDIGTGGLFNGSAIDVVTTRGCFHIDGPNDPSTIVATARIVAGKLS